MTKPVPPQLDMTLDGQFRRPVQPPLALRVGAVAFVVAVVAGAISIAALVLWFALALIPVALGAGVVAWIAFRVQMWRIRQSGRVQRPLYRR